MLFRNRALRVEAKHQRFNAEPAEQSPQENPRKQKHPTLVRRILRESSP
jgi:hypothetical protein